MKECDIHGNTEFYKRKDAVGYRCKKCKSDAVTKKRKERLVDIRGGGCFNCGYNKCMDALHFHHVEPANKSFELGINKLHKAIAVLIEEAEKCVVLCANCHAEYHAGLYELG